MNLLITSSSQARECARILLSTLHAKTEIAPDFHGALNRLRQEEFSTVVIDECTVDAAPGQVDVLLKHLGTAVPVFVNLGISRSDRVARDVTFALRRVEQERVVARHSAECELLSQIKGDLTGILLSAEQALSCPGIPEASKGKLKTVCELATRMRVRLGGIEN